MAVLEGAAEMEGASVTQSALCGARDPLQHENVTAAWNEVGLNGDSKVRVSLTRDPQAAAFQQLESVSVKQAMVAKGRPRENALRAVPRGVNSPNWTAPNSVWPGKVCCC